MQQHVTIQEDVSKNDTSSLTLKIRNKIESANVYKSFYNNFTYFPGMFYNVNTWGYIYTI